MNRRILAFGRIIRGTKLMRRAGDALVVRQYDIGRPGGRPRRAVGWLVNHDMVPKNDRNRSVVELVELFFDVVEAVGVDIFIEAGAKDASASVRAATDLTIPNVTAFEANPYTHRRFQESVSAHGVSYRHLALSDSAGDVDFLVRLTAEGEPMADGQGSLLERPGHEPGYERTSVVAVVLDDVSRDSAGSSVAMWIDVEGASSQVLRGATELLTRTDVVIIEVEERQSWAEQEWLHDDVVTFLEANGLVPVARDTQSRNQFNVMFVSERVLSAPDVADLVAVWRRR